MPQRLLLFVFGVWLAVNVDGSQLLAEDRTELTRTSNIHASTALNKVDKFHRKLVYFIKDIDLPCLHLPEPSKPVEPFFVQVRAYRFAKDNPLSCYVVMNRHGELVFSSYKAILRVNKENHSDKMVSLSELNVSAPDQLPANLHFDSLLYASNAEDVLYVRLSSASNVNVEQESETPYTSSSFVGRLDVKAGRLRVVLTNSPLAEIDSDSGWIYDLHNGSIERKDFNGKVAARWPLSATSFSCCLAPDKQNLLICRQDNTLSMLDLKTGRKTDLPVQGRAAVWGNNGIIYYISEEVHDDVLDTSLLRYRIGDKEPKRLFVVSCQRKNMKDVLLGVSPRLSADRSWLAWPLPVEDFYKYGTVLLDITNSEYRILAGRWDGVQW